MLQSFCFNTVYALLCLFSICGNCSFKFLKSNSWQKGIGNSYTKEPEGIRSPLKAAVNTWCALGETPRHRFSSSKPPHACQRIESQKEEEKKKNWLTSIRWKDHFWHFWFIHMLHTGWQCAWTAKVSYPGGHLYLQEGWRFGQGGRGEGTGNQWACLSVWTALIMPQLLQNREEKIMLNASYWAMLQLLSLLL